MKRLVRKWVNQPSNHQLYHSLHGLRVLFDSEDDTIYFTDGCVISMRLDPGALSDGWPQLDRDTLPEDIIRNRPLPNKKQKVVVVNVCNLNNELNIHLECGWTVVMAIPIPGLEHANVIHQISPRCAFVLEKEGE